MSKLSHDPLKTGSIVKEFYLGKTHVLICDEACRNRPLEEQRQSLHNVSRIASEALRERPVREAGQNQEDNT